MNIVVAVCTFKRPVGLARLLDRLAELRMDDGQRPTMDVVIIDSDVDGQEGLRTCAGWRDDYPYRIHVSVAPGVGISPARNAACDEALAVATALADSDEVDDMDGDMGGMGGMGENETFIAFLDDDEWPSPEWLAELLRVQRATDADAVGGPTRSVFPAGSDPALADIPYYGADMLLPDGAPCTLQAGGNFLIRAAILAQLAPDFFHTDFALSGSEDLAFFMRLHALGARMHWATAANVFEDVPADRLAPDWLRHRVVNVANGRVHAAQMLEPGLAASLVRGAKTAGLLVVAELVGLAGLVHRPLATKARLMRWRGRGKLMAHFGLRTERREKY